MIMLEAASVPATIAKRHKIRFIPNEFFWFNVEESRMNDGPIHVFVGEVEELL